MEDVGAAFGIILNHPELRQGFIREAERSSSALQGSDASRRLRHCLARTFRRGLYLAGGGVYRLCSWRPGIPQGQPISKEFLS